MNLVIGNTSQQSYYYPDSFIKLSSRNIDFNFLKDNQFDGVYITFAEQKIYDKNIDYMTPNFNYTIKIINEVINNCNKIVVFTSCELWSNLSGSINIDTPPNFDLSNEYTLSKLILFNEIKRLRMIDEKYQKVVVLHPFYFNSVHRNKYFLFGKIFDSIINKKKINVGNLNFYRDIVHTSFVVKKAIELKKDSMIGSGKLYNIRDFVIDLYKYFEMDYNYFVTEDLTIKPNDKMIRANVNWEYSYNDLLNDNIMDINRYKNIT